MILISSFIYPSEVNAQVANTLRVPNFSGIPGDTTLAISILLTNSLPVAGITFRIVYNNSLLTVTKVDTIGTRIRGIYNSFVTQTGPGWLYWCGINYYDPMHNSIPPGTGPIANIIFSVNPNVQFGEMDTIKFEDDDVLHYYNVLSDSLGTLIFPVLENGIFTVGTTNLGDSEDSMRTRIPLSFTLSQNYPNPFNAETMIRFAIPIFSHINLSVYNIAGQLVTTLVDEQLNVGFHTVRWNSKNNSDKEVSSGVYFLRIVVDDFVTTKKMILAK